MLSPDCSRARDRSCNSCGANTRSHDSLPSRTRAAGITRSARCPTPDGATQSVRLHRRCPNTQDECLEARPFLPWPEPAPGSARESSDRRSESHSSPFLHESLTYITSRLRRGNQNSPQRRRACRIGKISPFGRNDRRGLSNRGIGRDLSVSCEENEDMIDQFFAGS